MHRPRYRHGYAHPHTHHLRVIPHALTVGPSRPAHSCNLLKAALLPHAASAPPIPLPSQEAHLGNPCSETHLTPSNPIKSLPQPQLRPGRGILPQEHVFNHPFGPLPLFQRGHLGDPSHLWRLPRHHEQPIPRPTIRPQRRRHPRGRRTVRAPFKSSDFLFPIWGRRSTAGLHKKAICPGRGTTQLRAFTAVRDPRGLQRLERVQRGLRPGREQARATASRIRV